MKDVDLAPNPSVGLILASKRARRNRRVFFHNAEKSDEASEEMPPSSKQRARMAVRYPHLYSAPAAEVLQVLIEERTRASGSMG